MFISNLWVDTGLANGTFNVVMVTFNEHDGTVPVTPCHFLQIPLKLVAMCCDHL